LTSCVGDPSPTPACPRHRAPCACEHSGDDYRRRDDFVPARQSGYNRGSGRRLPSPRRRRRRHAERRQVRRRPRYARPRRRASPPGRRSSTTRSTGRRIHRSGTYTLGEGPQITQRNGRVEVFIPANATPYGPYGQISGAYEARCEFPADFDAQVDFELLHWTAGNGVSAKPTASVRGRFYPNGVFPQIFRRSLGNEEHYGSYVVTDSLNVITDDRQGRAGCGSPAAATCSLRITGSASGG
jgi:hypothetical protein